MNLRTRTPILAIAALVLSLAAHADLSFHVTLDTAALAGNASAPFALYFQLNDGSFAGDANNAATISHFTFGGGTGTGPATLDGGASGALGTGWTIVDSSFYDAVTQTFTAGSTLAFDVTLTTTADVGATPDEFSFAILDGSGSEIPTTGLGGPLLVVDIDSASPTIRTFATTGAYAAMGAPRLGDTVSPVPEPAASSLLVVGLASLLWRRRKGRAS